MISNITIDDCKQAIFNWVAKREQLSEMLGNNYSLSNFVYDGTKAYGNDQMVHSFVFKFLNNAISIYHSESDFEQMPFFVIETADGIDRVQLLEPGEPVFYAFDTDFNCELDSLAAVCTARTLAGEMDIEDINEFVVVAQIPGASDWCWVKANTFSVIDEGGDPRAGNTRDFIREQLNDRGFTELTAEQALSISVKRTPDGWDVVY